MRVKILTFDECEGSSNQDRHFVFVIFLWFYVIFVLEYVHVHVHVLIILFCIRIKIGIGIKKICRGEIAFAEKEISRHGRFIKL